MELAKESIVITPAICASCGKPCKVIPLRNEFNYAGTHCTHGLSGTHYPDNWGDPVSDCCEAPIEGT